MGKLTTHVLDTANGRPGSGVEIVLQKIVDNSMKTIGQFTTNQDGRCDRPLLEGEQLTTGEYLLVFHMGDYFTKLSAQLPNPKFLDKVWVRFGIADPVQHYHVPLVATPWSYSTYRGS